MQRNFGPLKQQVEQWREMQLSNAAATLLIHPVFIEEETGFPTHLDDECTSCTFSPPMSSSSRGPSGACSMHSRVRSKSWRRFRS